MNITLEIQNLKCQGCANTINTKLSDLEGIDNVAVNNEKNSVTFNYNTETNLVDAKKQLHSLGYPVIGEKNALTTKAKSFVSCAIGKINS